MYISNPSIFYQFILNSRSWGARANPSCRWGRAGSHRQPFFFFFEWLYFGTWHIFSIFLPGLEYIRTNKHAMNAVVVLLPFVGGFSRSLNTACRDMVSKGAVVIAAAGNYRDDACLYSPASEPEVTSLFSIWFVSHRWSLVSEEPRNDITTGHTSTDGNERPSLILSASCSGPPSHWLKLTVRHSAVTTAVVLLATSRKWTRYQVSYL